MSLYVWTDERIERLKEMALSGKYSAQGIANELGGITRNAVCGKLHRLGLSCRPNMRTRPVATGGISSEERAARVVRRRKKAEALRPPRRSAPELKPVPFVVSTVEVEPLHISLLDLTEDTCRWPYGDSPFTFCGCQVKGKGPYCAEHAEISRGQGTYAERAVAPMTKRDAA